MENSATYLYSAHSILGYTLKAAALLFILRAGTLLNRRTSPTIT